MPLDPLETEIVAQIRDLGPLLERRLEDLVDVSSFSEDHEGVDEVARRVGDRLAEAGFEIETRRLADAGTHLAARAGRGPGPRLLLVGHFDTVFPSGHAVGGYRIDPEDPTRILGPGVTDMKGGDVIMIEVAALLRRRGLLEGRPLTLVFSGDEELGSPSCRSWLEELAPEHDFALVFETGSERAGGVTTFVSTRKGVGRFTVAIEGVESHAGARKEEGLSAALEAAHKIIALEALNDPDTGTTVNVGVVRSGTAGNTVPGDARLEIDVRFTDPVHGDAVFGEIETIIGTPRVTDPVRRRSTRATCVDRLRNDPMIPDRRVRAAVEVVQRAGADLGLLLEEEFRGGASDGNIVSSAGCPVLDGLGTVGGKIHSAGEWARRGSLVDRAALLALLILRGRELVGGARR